MVEKKSNFRWKYIRNEYRQRVRCGDWEDWFTITRPKGSKSSGQISNTVVCYHLSSVLKTKNLYLQFDDENGIDTCGNLVTKALSGTGWSLGLCDIFYESDGKTEKIRSLSSTGKVGSYQLITNICGLFNAYPVYNGATKTVDIHALSNKLPQDEMIVGHNLTALSVELDSDSIVTRLYVEGEYGEDGYVGIDDVNPTGLSYLLNFDYYKEIGLFGDEHQAALDTYLADISETNNRIKELAAQITKLENDLNTIWGQPQFVYYVAGQPYYFSADVSEENKKQSLGQKVYVLQLSGDYYVENYSGGTGNDMVKFLTKSSYSMGSKEVAVEAKQKLIKSLEEDLQSVDEEDKPAIEEKIQSLRSEITGLYSGTSESEGLYSLMSRASAIIKSLKVAKGSLSAYQIDQARIEETFSSAMGDLLKDGYWANNNYIEGQEEFLYTDALEMSAELTKPTVTYSISLVQASDIWGEVDTEFFINSKVRIYDPELQVNDIVFVTKTVEYLDDESKGSVEISNDDLSIVGKSFDSILGRITQLADMIDQKTSLIDRAGVIGQDGTISITNLEGQIDLLKNKLISSTSNWYTDDNGNIIFLSVNGRSAMMLSGEGFMIANGKTADGEWNWRTFGTGEGFTADLITAGTISADRIKTGSIGVSKLSADLAETIQKTEIILEPGKITSIVRSSEEYQNDLTEAANSQKVKVYRQQKDPNEDKSITLNEGDLWIKTSADGNDLEESYVWDGSAWSPLTDSEHVSGLETRVTELSSQIEQTNAHIEATVTQKVEEVVKGEVENFIGDAVDDVIGDSAQEAVDNALAQGLAGYVKTTEMESAINIASEEITSSVSSQIKTVADDNKVISERQTKAEEKITPESIVDTVTTSDTFTTQYATREQTATAIEQAVGEVNGEVSSLKQTSNAIEARVSTNEKDIGQLKQTSEKFETQISDAEGNISRLEQDAEQFKISVGQDIEAKTSDATGQQMTLSFDRGGSVEVGFETLTCQVHVWKNGEEVTDLIPRGAFSWQRSSGITSEDAAWNATHKSTKQITLSRDEIGKSCQIKCILNAKGYYGYFDIIDGSLVIIRPDDGVDDQFELRGEDLYGDESYNMDEDGYVYKNGVPGQMSVTSTVFDHTVLETSHILIKDKKIEIRSGGDIDILANGSITLEDKAGLNVKSGGNINIQSGGNIDIASGGTFSIGSKNFTITKEGDVTVKGEIESESGNIGGWEITKGSLQSGSGTSHVELSTADSTYAIWAGAEESSSAPYRVSKDGTVYLTKLYVTDEHGTAQKNPVDLRTSYWKVDTAYAHSVKSMTVDGSGLHIVLYNGDKVDFNKATTATVVQTWSGGRLQIELADVEGNVLHLAGDTSTTFNSAAENVQWSGTRGDRATFSIGSDRGYLLNNMTLNAAEVYDRGNEAGWKEAAGQWKVNSGDTSFTVNTASPTAVGSSDAKTFTMTKGKPSAAGGKAAVSHNGVAVAQIDISDWWNEGHTAGEDSVDVYSPYVDRVEHPGSNSHLMRVYMQSKASNGAISPTASELISAEPVFQVGKTAGANSLAISPSTAQTLDYGKTVTVSATTENGSGQTITKSVNITAPADRYNTGVTDGALTLTIDPAEDITLGYGGRRVVTASTVAGNGTVYKKSTTIIAPPSNAAQSVERVATYNSSDVAYDVTVKVKMADGTTKDFDVEPISATGAHSAGQTVGAETLKISPSLNKTLAYGETVTVSATTENGNGATIEKSIDITAPVDRYGTGYNVGYSDGKETYNPTSITRTGYNTADKTVTVKAANSHQDLLTGVAINASEIFNAGQSAGVQAVKDNSSLSLSGADLTATVDATYADSTYKSLPLNGFYTNAFNKGAGAAIDASGLTQTVDNGGKTATGVISTVGIDGTKTITGIDVSAAYNTGHTAGRGVGQNEGYANGKADYSPTSIVRTGYDAVNKTITVKAANVRQDLLTGITIDVSEIWQAGWEAAKAATTVTGGISSIVNTAQNYYQANGWASARVNGEQVDYTTFSKAQSFG